MTGRKYAKCLISPEITNIQGLQALQFNAKDARGYDFSIQISAIEPDSAIREIPESVDADRVATYFGGTPGTIGDIGTEIEISMGAKPEVYQIDTAAMVYIPKGQSYRETILRKPDKRSWLLNITLPPKYIEPE